MAPNFRVLLEKAEAQIAGLKKIISNQDRIIEKQEQIIKKLEDMLSLSEERIKAGEEFEKEVNAILNDMREINTQLEIRTIYLAGGCFWGLQKFFDQFSGVICTEVGYANGPDKAPTYEEVCADSGHAETVRILYCESIISLEKLLDYYFMVIDPVSVNKQGHDEGIQYRTGIYYTDESQKAIIMSVYEREEEKAGEKLAVAVEPLRNFYSAEEYHQKYLEKNPGGYCHIPAKYYSLEQVKKDGAD